MENVEKFLKSYDAGKVLDIATGQGNFIPFILECKSYEKILAVDSRAVYKKAINQQFPDKKITFETANAYSLPFQDNSFDTVTLSNSIHHFQDPAKIMKEMKRVLKPEGRVIINEMYSDGLSKAQESHKMIHHISAKRDMILGDFHAETYSKKDLEMQMTSDFSKIELIDYTYPAGDVMEPGRIEHLAGICDKMIEQVGSQEKLQHLVPKLEKTKLYIQTNGYASASSLFFVGKK